MAENQGPVKNAETEKAVVRPGVYEGNYLDVYGHRGNIRFDLEGEEGSMSGKFQLTIASEDYPEKISGPLRVEVGREKEDEVVFHVLIGERQEPLLFTARIAAAGSYAEVGMFGEVLQAPQNFGGGVWIAWQFRNR